MQKNAPSLGRILLMVAFALSCVGILLYLWLTFGGSIPLKPKGYRVSVTLPEATTLAQEADVRISGVNVGKVKKRDVVVRGGKVKPLTRAELEIDHRYAPLPKDTRAILRSKTLLGETYVELAPGQKAGGTLPDGGVIPEAQVAPTVQLDEIFRTFDPTTRRAFQTWLQEQGTAFNHRGQDLNDALGNLTPFARNVNDLLAILRKQQEATSRLVRNTGVVFDALTERDGQLADLISNSNRVFQTTASRDSQLADTFRVLPTFLDESGKTSRRVTAFARSANPLITQLRPAARQLSPTLVALRGLAPDLRGLFRNLDPLITVSRRGLPALSRFLDQARPLLAQVDPFLRNVNPILDYLGLYKHEIASFFALDSASAQATDLPGGARRPIHYLRTTNPINPENLAAYPKRISTNRPNPYFEPLGYNNLGTGLKVFGSYLCTSNPVPAVSQTTDPLLPGIGAITNLISPDTFALIDQFAYGGRAPGAVPAPPCKEQAPLGRLLKQPGKYPHVTAAP